MVDLPGEKVLVKLVEALEKSVGGALRPWQIRRVEGANAEVRVAERLMLEQVERDAADIRSGKKSIDASGKLIENDDPKPLLLEGPASDITSVGEPEFGPHGDVGRTFAELANATSQAETMQRAINLKRIALFAEEDAEKIDSERSMSGPDSSSISNVDEDWLARWRVGAQDVKREEMQRLWATLLTGEVADPGKYSLHCVEFLARMSATDALLFSRLAQYYTNGGIIRSGDSFLDKQGFSLNDLLNLSDLGLINGVGQTGGLEWNLNTVERGGRYFASLAFCKSTVLVFDLGEIRTNGEAPKFSFPNFGVTRLGTEILSLGAFSPNEDYLLSVAKLAIEKGAELVKRGTLHADGIHVVGLQTFHEKEVAEQSP